MKGDYVARHAGDGERGSEHERQPVLHHAQDYGLPKNYTIFGQVTKGMDVVDEIVGSAAQRPGPAAIEPVAMTGIAIHED